MKTCETCYCDGGSINHAIPHPQRPITVRYIEGKVVPWWWCRLNPLPDIVDGKGCGQHVDCDTALSAIIERRER